MKKATKREITESVALAVSALLNELKISKPSRKTSKAVSKASKALKNELKSNIKKEARKAKSKTPLNGKAHKPELVANT